jgi:hypothetical protein
MNQLLPYEQQIAEQMQLVPAPDMQDAVWARIEAMLDADIHLEENNTPQKIEGHKNFNSSLALTAGIIILSILVTLVINRKQKSKNFIKQKPSITVPRQPVTIDKQEQELQNKPKMLPEAKQIHMKKNYAVIKKINSLFQVPPAESNIDEFKKPDSILRVKLPPLALQKKDSIMKKPKGVKGISDSDYRFTMPKKDSML